MKKYLIEEPFYNKPVTLCISKKYSEFAKYIVEQWASEDIIIEEGIALWQQVHIPWVWRYIYLSEVDRRTIIHEVTHLTRKMWEYIGHWNDRANEYYTYAMEYYCKKIFEKLWL